MNYIIYFIGLFGTLITLYVTWLYDTNKNDEYTLSHFIKWLFDEYSIITIITILAFIPIANLFSLFVMITVGICVSVFMGIWKTFFYIYDHVDIFKKIYDKISNMKIR